MKKLILVAALALAGCATGEYNQYTAAQVQIQKYKSDAETARVQALAAIATNGDATARVAAVMALQFSQQAQPTQQIVAPRSPGETALQWASILVPTLGQAYAVNKNAQVAMNSSNNQTQVGLAQIQSTADVTRATNGTFVSIAELIQNPTVLTQPAPVLVPTQVVQPQIVNPQVVQPTVIRCSATSC